MNKKEMIQSVREFLFSFENVDERILKAMDVVDRKFFVSDDLKDVVYEDMALGILLGQTISQPSTVARMLSLLNLKKGDSILEVGAGSGWNACLIGYLIYPGKIITTEVIKEVCEFAKKNIKEFLKENKIKMNVKVLNKSGFDTNNSWDKIIFTAGIGKKDEVKIEKFAEEHLNNKGVLVCPFKYGSLIIISKKGNLIKKRYTEEDYVFVPLV